MQLSNKKWDLDYFMSQREEVLKAWPTGSEVDLDEAIAYQAQIPGKRFVTS